MIKIMFLILAILLTQSCKKIKCTDDDLSFRKTEYTKTELRIDGYYVEHMLDSSEKYTTLKFFYQSGVVLGFLDYNNEANNSGNIDVEQINNSLKSKAAWGQFRVVNNNIIEIEQWTPSYFGCYNTVYEKGEIKNDTTFVITCREYRDKGKTEKVETQNSTFYFHPLDIKPDSTNNFVR
jgi:hypothetical protein